MQKRVAAAGTREVELFSNALTVSDQTARAITELQQAHDSISTHGKELAKIAQLKFSIKSLEDNVAFYMANEDEQMRELAAAMNDCTEFTPLVDKIRAEVVDLLERLGAKDGVIRSIVDNSCSLLGPSTRGSVGGFRAGLNK